MKKIAFITGATSGIGQATARLLAQQQFNIVACGRRQDRLNELETELSALTEIKTLAFDVRNKQEVESAFNSLPDEWKNADVLINNAGNAHGLSPFDKGNLDDWDAMIDTNVKGLLYVSHHLVPRMVSRKSGHIVNLGSIAGKEVYPNGNIYCASKFAVDAINVGMRLDLNAYGIKVTSISPGMVETEFSVVRFGGDKERAKNVYKGLEPLTAQDIAETIWFCLNRPAHVNIADIVIYPTAQASATISNRN